MASAIDQLRRTLEGHDEQQLGANHPGHTLNAVDDLALLRSSLQGCPIT